MKIISILFITALLISTNTFGQFFLADNGVPVSYHPKPIYCINADTVFVASDSTIYKTTDGGNNWYPIYSQNEYNFSSLLYINNDIGFVSGADENNNGILLKTVNGGLSWSNMLSPASGRISKLHFVNDTLGYFLKCGSLYDNIYGSCFLQSTIYKTVNQGNNWILLSNNPGLRDIFFINEFLGFATGIDGSFSTVDGGNTWTSTPDIGGISVNFINDSMGFLGGEGGFIDYTIDGGDTWQSIYGQIDCSTAQSFYFPSDSIGYIAGYTAMSSCRGIYKTIDGGYNWSKVFEVYPESFRYVHFVNDTVGYVTGERIWKTTTGGILDDTVNVIKPIPNNVPFESAIFYFQDEIIFEYNLNTETFVNIQIYDLTGKKIKTLVDNHQTKGKHNIKLHTSPLAKGIYLCRFSFNGFVKTEKIIVQLSM